MLQKPGFRLEVADPSFFATPLTKMTVEQNEGTGRTYILKGDRILAVAKLPAAIEARGPTNRD